jgi:hypothetical protein
MQKWFVKLVTLTTLTIVLAGCIADPGTTRTIVIHQLRSDSDTQPNFVVDTSKLPPGAVLRCLDRTEKSGSTTDIELNSSQVKIIIVPVTQP